MKSLSDIRNAFLSYFKDNGHEVVPSSSLVPHNDPTLLFTNAGMVQFKDIFTGRETRHYKKATTSQKCLRAGGKHNDLENVGYTARHHTFFEMLGNFSFGDYFKEEAIYYAWNFITKELGVDKSKLLTTVYAEDEQAYELWQKIAGITPIKIPTNDNFWAMGDTGPCGPCSEIFYDHGPSVPGGPPGSPDSEGDRFMEIWNLVFMQFEQTPTERLNLPKPSIDTGMGLERIATVLQGIHDNYDTDLFSTIIEASKNLVKRKNCNDLLWKHAHRVIADHIRSITFLIADGVIPSNEGRGYVLRRILRRAMRYAYQIGVREPFLFQLVPTLVGLMGSTYPEIVTGQEVIGLTIKLEEEKFLRTLEQGMSILEHEQSKSHEGKFSGKVAFTLYDTYGFPLDLTEDFLKTHQQFVDLNEFTQCMDEQKQRSRASWKGSGDAVSEKIWFDLQEEHGATEFVGYIHDSAQGIIKGIIKDSKEVREAFPDDHILLIANQTPFYGESGGQLGDQGTIHTQHGTLKVTDTQKKEGLIIHHCIVEKGKIEVGQIIDLQVDMERRKKLKKNHSVTHLLHGALRDVLGHHVTQKGSLVAPDRIRFDFNNPGGLTKQQIMDIEIWVNNAIQEAVAVQTEILSIEHAKQKGATALFGEKYGEIVRVVSMGDISIEFCGGTHVKNTGEIGCFKIVSETSVASGIRRIEAVTGQAVIGMIYDLETSIQQKQKDYQEQAKIDHDKIIKLQKQVMHVETPILINGTKVYARIIDDVDVAVLRKCVTQYPADALVVLISKIGGKVNCVISVGKDILSLYNAKDIAEKASKLMGGSGGGGHPNLAQAGGTTCPNNLEQFLISVLFS